MCGYRFEKACHRRAIVLRGKFIANLPEERVFRPTLKLNNLQNTRKSFSRILRAYASDEVDGEKAKILGYLFSQFLSYMKTEKEVELEKRIEALERKEERRNAKKS